MAFLGSDAADPSGTRPPVAGVVTRSRAVLHPSAGPSAIPKPRPASWTTSRLTTSRPKQPIDDLGQLVPAPPDRSIALTLDDGPSPNWTPKVLDLLAEHDVRATFFTIGSQVKEYPKVTRRIVEAGHQICNHTMTHPMFTRSMPKRRLVKEVRESRDRIADISGVVPTFFRAPGGIWTPQVLDAVGEYGMLPLDWSVDPRDWARPGAGRIRKSMLKCRSGNILLTHDGGGDRSQTLKALRQVIPELKKRGMTFVSL